MYIMAQSALVEPDWGAAINLQRQRIADSEGSDIVTYTIAGRTVTKSKEEAYRHLEWLQAQYDRVLGGSAVTLVDMSGELRRGY